MKIKCQFGMWDGNEHITWYRDISDFPKIIKYQGDLYEFTMYSKEDPGHPSDYTFHFSRISSIGKKYAETPDFKQMFAHCFIRSTDCQCGAKHDRSNPAYHMSFCPKRK